jgi:hypothetical protein
VTHQQKAYKLISRQYDVVTQQAPDLAPAHALARVDKLASKLCVKHAIPYNDWHRAFRLFKLRNTPQHF